MMDLLIRFLAGYIAKRLEAIIGLSGTENDLKNWIKDGLKAFEPAQNHMVVVTGGNCPDCCLPLELGSADLYEDSGNRVEVSKYECPGCGFLIYC